MTRFTNLPKKKQSAFLKAQFFRVRRISRQQLSLLEKYRKLHTDSPYFFTFLSETIDSFWRDCEFIHSLGVGRWKGYAMVIARMTLEKCLKLIYLTRQDEEERKKIVRMDLMRICRRFYWQKETNSSDTQEFVEAYEKLKKSNEPEINASERDSDLNLFPGIPKMLKDCEFQDWKTIYFQYQTLCDKIHGGLFQEINLKSDVNRQYIIALFLMQRFAIEMVKVTDFHLYGEITKETKEFIEKEKGVIDIYD